MSRTDQLLNELKINRQDTITKKKRRWPFYVIIGVILIAAMVFVFGTKKAIEIETVNPRSAAESGPASVLDASGYVTARRIATVSSKVTGKVKEVYIEEGQRVNEGDILARLDPMDAEAQRDVTQSQLASSQSQLAEAQSQLILAKSNYSRNRELAEKQLVSRQALDTAKAELDTRVARLNSLQKQVELAKNQKQVSQLGVDNTIIRAPFTGVIIAKAAQPGEMISPISAGGGSIRTGIGTLVDMDSLEVQVDVNEAYIGRVTPQMPIEAVLNAYPEWKIPGEVIAIIPTADRSKATVKVRVALDSKDTRIVPDMGVRVSFLEAKDTSKPLVGFWIPNSAIVKEGEQAFVFTVQDGKAKRVAITTIESNDSDTLVNKGISKGDSIIASPGKDLADGSKVALKSADKK
ncbi:MAG: efflux RND transporter periplasmic adaptor subunit [Arenimonas sp.]|nr:efflux RND transporter periplasmic adaptor subunit [Arenimonas sp.]